MASIYLARITEKKLNEASRMKVQPTLHWNNFTVPELKDILKHCVALERLGIAQDEEMICSIERDIAIREKNIRPTSFELKSTKISQQITPRQTTKRRPKESPLVQTA